MAIKSADQITIVDVTDAYSVGLTSESYTFVGGINGAASGVKCTTSAYAYCGTNQCATVTVEQKNIVCPNGITAAVTNSGSATPTITFTSTSIISTDCEATIPVTVDGITVNKKFSFAVAKTGATGATGPTGNGIKTITNKYAVSTSNTTAPTSWSDDVPSLSATDKYLWNYELITYTDNTTAETEKRVIGVYGDQGIQGIQGETGNGIISITNHYLATTAATGVTTSTSGWTTAVQSTTATKKYLWAYEVIKYTNGSEVPTTPRIIGTYGDKGDKGDDSITLTITSSNGTIFKNSSGSTVLTAHVFVGAVEQTITDAGVCGTLGSIKWYKGVSTTPVATSKTYTVSASDVVNSVVFTAQLE